MSVRRPSVVFPLAVEIAPRTRQPRPPRQWYQWAKPLMDVALAVAGLVVLGPLMLVVALLVRLDSPGAAFYRQVRVGRDRRSRRAGDATYSGPDRRQRNIGGKPFQIVKFRSMRIDAEAETGAVWAQGHEDPRITRLGRVLRSSHVDELPQLVNVLRGDMSLVGPRPERPEFFVGLASEVPGYGRRTTVRPGVTGLAQVLHKYDETLDDVRRKVEFDLQYIEDAGLLADLKILFGTVRRCWDELWEAVGRGRSSRRETVPAQS